MRYWAVSAMTMEQICNQERSAMNMRYRFGYTQYDDHIWRWLNYELKLWCESHPIKIARSKGAT